MKFLLLFLLVATTAAAQEVQPIVSPDYLRLVNSQRTRAAIDSATSLLFTPLRTHQPLPVNGQAPGRITVKGYYVTFGPPTARDLYITGTYGASVDLKSVNRLPALQNTYVQGRPINGTPAWQGPETNELFSFGPNANTLAWDGQAYPYDRQGRLVPQAPGLTNAHAYANKLFRTGRQINQSMNLQLRYRASRQDPITANIKIGRADETLVLPGQRNTSRDLNAGIKYRHEYVTYEARYASLAQDLALGNRFGQINHIYKSALLTPISFDNSQGYLLAGGQRSYSGFANNPFYLLKAANGLRQGNRSGLLSIVRNTGRFSLGLVQTLTASSQQGDETYAQSIRLHHGKNDFGYQAHINTKINFQGGHLFSNRLERALEANYIWSYDKTSIKYDPGVNYQYRRSSSDASLAYTATLNNGDNRELSLRVGDKLYGSGTTRSRFFLPNASAVLDMYRFENTTWRARAGASWSRFNNEPSVSTSFASYSLMRYRVEDAFTYFPVSEISTFNGLLPIRHREATAFLELNNRLFKVRAEVFDRYTRDDIFPVLDGSGLRLMNLADDRNRGFEVELGVTKMSRDVRFTGAVSFFTNRNTVVSVRDGFEGTPVAGFRDVYKALIPGQQLGAIVGSRYLRNASGQMVIGTDGFPLVDPKPGVIGRANPDFTIKSTHELSWKKWTLSVDAEWSKGGQVWNGTQALLDYYGRSAITGDQRGWSNYVFEGVLADGHPNNIPVRFYDPSLPVTQNRWTRYGAGGIAEEYIQKADNIRLNTLGLAYRIKPKKYIQSINLNLYVHNLILWSATPGLNTRRLLYDAAGTEGLDLFNLPSLKTFGFQTSIQF